MLQEVQTALSEAHVEWQGTITNLVKDIFDIGGSVLDMCQEKYDRNPDIFDGCEPVHHDTQELIDLVNQRIHPRDVKMMSRGVGNSLTDVAGGLERAVGDIGDFAKDAITGHPYDALKDITNTLAETISVVIQTATIPVELLTQTGALAYKAVKGDDPYECECKLEMTHWIVENGTVVNLLKNLNQVLLTFGKEYADEIAYEKDPTKIGACIVTLLGGLVAGLEKGLVNGALDCAETGFDAFQSLSEWCPYFSGDESIMKYI